MIFRVLASECGIWWYVKLVSQLLGYFCYIMRGSGLSPRARGITPKRKSSHFWPSHLPFFGFFLKIFGFFCGANSAYLWGWSCMFVDISCRFAPVFVSFFDSYLATKLNRNGSSLSVCQFDTNYFSAGLQNMYIRILELCWNLCWNAVCQFNTN